MSLGGEPRQVHPRDQDAQRACAALLQGGGACGGAKTDLCEDPHPHRAPAAQARHGAGEGPGQGATPRGALQVPLKVIS